MKKQIFTLSLFFIFTGAFAQKDLRLQIRGERGLTQSFTTLDKNLQIAFNPANAKIAFGLDAYSDLVLQKSETDDLGMIHYRYYQTYKGIAIENTMYIAHTEKGRLTSLSGTVVTEFDPQIEKRSFSLSSEQAIENALNYVHAEKYAWEDSNFQQRIKFRNGNNASYYPSTSKVWYSGPGEINPSHLTQAYKVDVYSLVPLDRKYVYVDAQSGEILGTNQIIKHSDAKGTAYTGYSGAHTIHSDFTGSAYRLRDYTKGNGIITLHANGSHSDYTSSTANFKYSNVDQWALDAHYGVVSTYNFYKNNFNRNSIDNAGYLLISWVNDPNNPDNAYWDGSEMDYGNLSSNGKGVVGIDVIGHELTHGVTERTSGLTYSGEPGAMNESMSDIMGKSVQFYTKPNDSSWILSNDMSWEIRDFSNPNADGQPDTYKGTYWVTGSSDNYGVHTNSGVGNFMFYLLVKGGSGTNDIGKKYSVSGIGLAKADKIIYRTNTTYLTSMSQYADWRIACIQAAKDLYGDTSNEVKQVQNAWYAVGIGTASGTVTGITYCASKGTSTAYEFIKKVAVGTISNTSTNNSGYNDYTALKTNLTAGKTYSITLTPGFTSSSYTEYWTVYIDYNRDGTLNGPGETVAGGNGTTAKTLSFTVPSTAKTGSTRLRIQMSYGSSFIDPCATFNYGEVEDYTVNIGSATAVAPIVAQAEDIETSLTISPNPVTGSNALIQYNLATDGKVRMRLISVDGRSLRNEELGYQKAGMHTYNLSTPGTLPTGNYIIVLQQNNIIIERKHIMINK
ncbi:M4 family metallopeptidase [Segetibacter koreensis]|uniref:M4 family metallopeptidase n=1 Tax=Segetibacter koreensis TaxID=398037 RepID=UPI000360A8AD|nr:M4 family metallopeptidase [Segetibacter koreensis]